MASRQLVTRRSGSRPAQNFQVGLDNSWTPAEKPRQHLEGRARRVPHNIVCNSSSCHSMQGSPETLSDADAEQIVPRHTRTASHDDADRPCTGRHTDTLPAQGGPTWPRCEPSLNPGTSAWSAASPSDRSQSPGMLRDDALAAVYQSLTVPVVEASGQGDPQSRKRPRHTDVGSTTDLVSLPHRQHRDQGSHDVSQSACGAPQVNDGGMNDLRVAEQLAGHQQLGRRAKMRRSGADPPARGLQSEATSALHSSSSWLDDANPVPWMWQPQWAEREDPVPARLVQVASIQRPKHPQLSADVLSSIEFSQDGMLLATAGRTKQVRVYSLADLNDSTTTGDSHVTLVSSHHMPSKLSCVTWSPDEPGVATVSDYDGQVAQLDLCSGHWLGDYEELDGRKVWSVAHSPLRPHTVACASDNGTLRLMVGRGLEECAASVVPAGGAAVCGASFSSVDEHLVAAACADALAYVFDLRRLNEPLHVLRGHSAPVSFVRFLGRQLVTSSTDSTLGWWDLDNPAHLRPNGSLGSVLGASKVATSAHRLRTMRGHANHKNFVGLSVREQDSLIACGSEMGCAYAYHTSWDSPMANATLPVGTTLAHGQPALRCLGSAPVSKLAQGLLGEADGAQQPPLVSAVAWRPLMPDWYRRTILAAASSEGELELLSLEVC